METVYFDIVAGVLKGDTFVPFLFIICVEYMLRTSIDKMKDNSFKLTKERSRRYPAQTITDADCADDIAHLTNTPTQAETLLHSLKLEDKFTYHRSSVSSTETDINTQLTKSLTAFDRLSVMSDFHMTDKMKLFFSKLRSYRYICMDALHGR